MTVSIVIRRPDNAMRADESDLAAVRTFAGEHGLEITSENPDTRTIKVCGTQEQLASAFGVAFTNDGGYTHTTKPVEIPQSLEGSVIAVLGLDQRPIARRLGQ